MCNNLILNTLSGNALHTGADPGFGVRGGGRNSSARWSIIVSYVYGTSI